MRNHARRAGGALRSVLVSVLILTAGLFVAKHFLLDSAAVPESSGYVLDIERVRALATQTGQPLPERVNAVHVASAEQPHGVVVAGAGLDRVEMVRTAFQVVYPDDGRTIIIDTTYDRSQHERRAAELPFDDAAFEAVQQAMRRAHAIVVTHEHADHLGGLARSPHLQELLTKALLTPEQLSDPTRLNDAGFASGALDGYEALRYRGMHAVAPGMVLIKAPGHSPGSQMIYVRLASDRELLFVGDIAWNMENIESLTGRPLLVTYFFLREDRAAVLAQLRSLHELLQREPQLQPVVAHDGAQLQAHVAAGRISMGFE
jgi:glyoxylase-like metal-dependent hydrolase (beta-lactamase superfamily II)